MHEKKKKNANLKLYCELCLKIIHYIEIKKKMDYNF